MGLTSDTRPPEVEQLRADLKKCGDDCRAVLADSLVEVERLLRAVENQTEIALRYLTRAEVAEAEVERLREGLQRVIDCPDFSARRAFTMKMIARAALEKTEAE